MINTLFIHQFEPKFENFIIHHDIIKKLKSFVNKKSIEMNMLIHGPKGSGKFSIIMGLMHHIFGDTALKYTRKTRIMGKKEMNFESNNNFMIINAANFPKTRVKLIVNFLKDISRSSNIFGGHNIAIIKNYELLDKTSQEQLLRIMETKSGILRIIAIVSSTNRIIPAMRSRFLILRVPSPTKEEIMSIFKIYKNLNKYPYQKNRLERIINKFDRNLWITKKPKQKTNRLY